MDECDAISNTQPSLTRFVSSIAETFKARQSNNCGEVDAERLVLVVPGGVSRVFLPHIPGRSAALTMRYLPFTTHHWCQSV